MCAAHSVKSRDGSVIGFESHGGGPPMVLVHGGTADRTRWTPVLAQLAEHYTVHVLDRRGRGLSAEETSPYDISREGEDIAAVAEAVGGDVYLIGHSYGALCSLEAALRTDAIGRMFLYEPPARTPGHEPTPQQTLERLRAASRAGDQEQVLEIFFRELIHVSPVDIAAMKRAPIWTARLAAAPTIVRELDTGEVFDISGRLSEIKVPVRLLLGTESPPYFRAAAEAIAGWIASADIVSLHGQAHMGIDHDPAQFVAAVLAFAEAASTQS